MAKHDIDPVLRQLARSVNESGQAVVPVVLTVHGIVLRGNMVSEARYFTELAGETPLMSALAPESGLLGKEYVNDVEAESGRYLHLRAARPLTDDGQAEGLWRVGIDAVDAWTLSAATGSVDPDDKGPFGRLFASSSLLGNVRRALARSPARRGHTRACPAAGHRPVRDAAPVPEPDPGGRRRVCLSSLRMPGLLGGGAQPG
jgi:hypothetical protein